MSYQIEVPAISSHFALTGFFIPQSPTASPLTTSKTCFTFQRQNSALKHCGGQDSLSFEMTSSFGDHKTFQEFFTLNHQNKNSSYGFKWLFSLQSCLKVSQDQRNLGGFLCNFPPEIIRPALTRQNNTSQGELVRSGFLFIPCWFKMANQNKK